MNWIEALLAGGIGVVALVAGVYVIRIERRLRELAATLNALAEMLGEEIDRRRLHGE